MKHSLILILVYLFTTQLFADVKPNALFSDGMVIQCNQNAPIWGSADPGEAITISASWGVNAQATADTTGKWMTHLQTPAPGYTPYTITINGKNKIVINDVLSGQVWVCSGQSNIDMRFRQITKYKKGLDNPAVKSVLKKLMKDLNQSNDSKFRFFQVEKVTSYEPLTSCTGAWKTNHPDNNREHSMVAYYFGKKLRAELDVPVGIVAATWGGTRIHAWTRREVLAKDPVNKALADQYTPEHIEKELLWCGSVFNGIVRPIIPYAISGVLWYQGEGNSGEEFFPGNYGKSMRDMITDWRHLWGQGDFSFYYVQLPDIRSKGAVEGPWVPIREQMLNTLAVKNTGMIVTTDLGDPGNVHPPNKIDVGSRLALWALAKNYGQDIVYSGPLYKSHEIKNSEVIISFDHVGSGLIVGQKSGYQPVKKVNEPLADFMLRAKGGEWFPAEAEIVGDTVVVSCDKVKSPAAARFAWASSPVCNFYNAEGLPASPFRTDQFDDKQE